MSAYELLRGHLKANAPAPVVFDAAHELFGNILRGDMMIGLLPIDAGDVMVAGLQRAGNEGVIAAWTLLAQTYLLGVGVDEDFDAAIAPLRHAADAGGRDAVLAFCEHVYFRARDPELGEEVARRVNALLPDDSDGRAHLLCGYLAYQGFGLAKDLAASLRYHTAAAERGNRDAMFELYVLFSTGQGVAKDEAVALAWCKKAAEHGQARAAYNLGAFFATGRGVDKDPAQSIAWYEKASDAGHGRASAMAGYMFLVGDGIAIDVERAKLRFAMAEEQSFDVEGFLEQVGVERPE